MGLHNILSKVDRALVAYLISFLDETGPALVGAEDIYPAKRSGDKALPNTVCHSQRWRPLVPNSGVYVVTAQILVHTDPSADVNQSAEEKKQTSEERVGATFDAFFARVAGSSSALAAAITEAAHASGDEDLQDFVMQGCEVTGGDAGHDEKRNAWMDAIDLEIVCRPGNA